MNGYTPNKFQQGLDLICEANLDIQRQFRDKGVFSDISVECAIREFRTIHVSAGRRIGKTEWATDQLENKACIVICANHPAMSVYPQQYRGRVFRTDAFRDSPEDINISLCGYEINRIILDERWGADREPLDETVNRIYHTIKAQLGHPYQFIVLGE